MPGPQPTTTISGDAVILNLDYLQISESSGNFAIPYLNGPLGLTYLDTMLFAGFNDFTTEIFTGMMDIPAMVLLGDIWGATAGNHQAPQPQYQQTFFNSDTSGLNGGSMFIYQIKTVPPNVDETFGGENFFNFGRMAFGYSLSGRGVCYGKSHWLEHTNGVIFAEAPEPDFVTVYLKPGVQLDLYYDSAPSTVGAGFKIASEVNSTITGILTGIGGP